MKKCFNFIFIFLAFSALRGMENQKDRVVLGEITEQVGNSPITGQEDRVIFGEITEQATSSEENDLVIGSISNCCQQNIFVAYFDESGKKHSVTLTPDEYVDNAIILGGHNKVNIYNPHTLTSYQFSDEQNLLTVTENFASAIISIPRNILSHNPLHVIVSDDNLVDRDNNCSNYTKGIRIIQER